MAIKLHRCPNMWVKIGAHPCWRVQKALDEQGVPYEVVKGPFRRGQRDDLERLSGQRHYPVIEFEDGVVYREQSADMAATIRAGNLATKDTGATAHAEQTAPPQQAFAGTPPEAPPHEDLPTQPGAEPPMEPPPTV